MCGERREDRRQYINGHLARLRILWRPPSSHKAALLGHTSTRSLGGEVRTRGKEENPHQVHKSGRVAIKPKVPMEVKQKKKQKKGSRKKFTIHIFFF